MNPTTPEECWRLRRIWRAWKQGFRLATPDEVKYADPSDIFQFVNKEGLFVGPHFVRKGYNGI